MICDRLKEERKRLGASQEEFAGIAGVTRRPYAEWEAGKTSPTAVQLAALGEAGADVQYIINGQRAGGELTADELQLLELFRAAPLAGKMAAVGALQGAMNAAAQVFNAPISGGVAGRNIINKGKAR